MKATIEEVLCHEAGHAVAADALGWEIREISLGESAAQTSYTHADERFEQGLDANEITRRYIRFFFGGIAANRWALRDRLPERAYSLWSWRGDILEINNRAEMIARNLDQPVEHAAEIIREEEDRADALARDRWPAIDALARAIRGRQTMLGDEAHRIIKKALAAGGPGVCT